MSIMVCMSGVGGGLADQSCLEPHNWIHINGVECQLHEPDHSMTATCLKPLDAYATADNPKACCADFQDPDTAPGTSADRFAAIAQRPSPEQLSEVSTSSSPQPLSAQRLRDKYNRMYAMADSAPEGPFPELPHGVMDAMLQQSGDSPSSSNFTADAALSIGRGNNPRADVHLSLTEFLLLQEDSVAESRATPLLTHRMSMMSNYGDASRASFSALSPSMSMPESELQLRSPRARASAESALSQQAGSSEHGWPGPAPEWISIVVRGKHKDRETFAQYHVPEELVYVGGNKLSLKVCTAAGLHGGFSSPHGPKSKDGD